MPLPSSSHMLLSCASCLITYTSNAGTPHTSHDIQVPRPTNLSRYGCDAIASLDQRSPLTSLLFNSGLSHPSGSVSNAAPLVTRKILGILHRLSRRRRLIRLLLCHPGDPLMSRPWNDVAPIENKKFEYYMCEYTGCGGRLRRV